MSVMREIAITGYSGVGKSSILEDLHYVSGFTERFYVPLRYVEGSEKGRRPNERETYVGTEEFEARIGTGNITTWFETNFGNRVGWDDRGAEARTIVRNAPLTVLEKNVLPDAYVIELILSTKQRRTRLERRDGVCRHERLEPPYARGRKPDLTLPVLDSINKSAAQLNGALEAIAYATVV